MPSELFSCPPVGPGFLAVLSIFLLTGCPDTEGGGDGGAGPDILQGPVDEWTFIPVEGMVCGTGTDTGVGFNPAPDSDRLLVFFQGGGACYNAGNCLGADPAASHFDGFGDAQLAEFASDTGAHGIFDRADADNPFADFNWVFLPYCTGDVHIGNRVTDDELHFVGQQNLKAALPRIVETYPAPAQYFVGGQSAGGFGAMYNFYLFREAYGDVEGHMFDDSGPFFPLLDAPALSFLLGTYDLATTAAEGCELCLASTEPGGGLHNLIPYYAEAYPDARISLISSYQDDTIAPRFMLDPMKYEMLLGQLATDTAPLNPNFRVYYLTGDHHVWTDGDEDTGKLGDVVSDGVTLADFLKQQVDGDGWVDVVP